MSTSTTEILPPSQRKRSPMTSAFTPSTPRAQWLTPWMGTLPMTEYDNTEQRLHDEIIAFGSFMAPSAQETQARQHVLNAIEAIIKRCFETCKVSTFGSVAYGLSLPGGDLDLVIETPEVCDKSYLVRSLFRLSSVFRKAGIATACDVIPHARVPIIKLKVVPALGSFDFDISLNATDGLRAVPVIKHYLDELPALRLLVLVVKTFLSNRGLQSAATGGLSSYAIICLVIGFLKLNPRHYEAKFLQSPVENESFGTLLFDFFDFYADVFPYETSYLSPTRGSISNKEDKSWVNLQRPNALSIECLIDPSNDVGKSAQKIKRIRAAFRAAASTIRTYKLSLDHGNVLGSILGVSQQMLASCNRIRALVDSGELEASLKSITLPPAIGARPRDAPYDHYRRQDSYRPPSVSSAYAHSHRHHPYTQHHYQYQSRYGSYDQRSRDPYDLPYDDRNTGYRYTHTYRQDRDTGKRRYVDRHPSPAYHSPKRRRV